MNEMENLVEMLAALPPGGLSAALILAAFGLAAYAIHAVLTVIRKEK